MCRRYCVCALAPPLSKQTTIDAPHGACTRVPTPDDWCTNVPSPHVGAGGWGMGGLCRSRDVKYRPSPLPHPPSVLDKRGVEVWPVSRRRRCDGGPYAQGGA